MMGGGLMGGGLLGTRPASGEPALFGAASPTAGAPTSAPDVAASRGATVPEGVASVEAGTLEVGSVEPLPGLVTRGAERHMAGSGSPLQALLAPMPARAAARNRARLERIIRLASSIVPAYHPFARPLLLATALAPSQAEALPIESGQKLNGSGLS